MIGGKNFSIIALLVLGICFLLGVTLLRCDDGPERARFLGTLERVVLPKKNHMTTVTATIDTPAYRVADDGRGRQLALLL